MKANTLIADAYICFDYLKVPKKIKILQDKAEGFTEQEFLFPCMSSSAHVGFALIPTFSLKNACGRRRHSGWTPVGSTRRLLHMQLLGSCTEIKRLED